VNLRDFENYMRFHPRRERAKGDSTIALYLSHVRRYLEWCDQSRMRPGVESARRFIVGLAGRKAPNTVHLYTNALRCYFRFLGQELDIVPPPLDYKLPKPLSRDEWDTLVNHLNSVINASLVPRRTRSEALAVKALVYLLGGAGLRISEAVGMRVEDVDFDNRRVRVVGKGRQEALVPVEDAVLDAIGEYIARLEIKDELFPGWTAGAARHKLTKMAEWAGVKVTPHALRHTAATELLRLGAGLYDVSRFLRHRRIETTTRYIHLTTEDLAERLPKRFG
jgi:integrase/recombinase XerD